MSRRRREQLAVAPEMLDNPERDLDLMNRYPAAVLEPETPEPEAVDGTAEFRRRIVEARRMEPPDVGCRSCWQHGKEAALALIGDSDDVGGMQAGIVLARTIRPSGSELHWRDCWEEGRDAALKVIEGE